MSCTERKTILINNRYISFFSFSTDLRDNDIGNDRMSVILYSGRHRETKNEKKNYRLFSTLNFNSEFIYEKRFKVII